MANSNIFIEQSQSSKFNQINPNNHSKKNNEKVSKN